MPHIDYYFTTISPFVYLAGGRLEVVADKHGATVTYKPLDLGALMARTGGTPLPERHPSRVEYRTQELLRWAAHHGVPLNPKPMFFPTNGRPAAYAIIAAQSAGGDVGKLVQEIASSVWAREKNIAEDDVIRTCLEVAGFDPDLADKGLMAGAETYARNLEEAVARGVFGSPFYITDTDQRFWGQDRIAALDAYLEANA